MLGDPSPSFSQMTLCQRQGHSAPQCTSSPLQRTPTFKARHPGGCMASVRWEAADGIAVLTVDRPEALNALNREVLEGIRDAATAAAESGAKALIVTGAGKAFVAGADIAQMASMNDEAAAEFSSIGQDAFDAVASFPGPVIAAVNGYALGGGCELALACDFMVASEKAVLGQPEVQLGVVPGFGGSQRLPRRIGSSRAKWLLMSGAKVKADEALAMGLVDRVVAPEALMETCRAMAKEIMANGPLAVQVVKDLVDEGAGLVLEDALAQEVQGFGYMFSTADQKEGMKAFLEKRKPVWKGK